MKQIKKLSFLFFAAAALVFTSCDPAIKTELLPVLSTSKVTAITPTTATSGGDITSDGGSAVTARGVCWSTKANPTIADTKTSDGTGFGAYTSSITGLTLGTTYYVRAYATNKEGTAYGLSSQFIAAEAFTAGNPDIVYGNMTDQDGNTYHTVTIGTQTWMAENLRTTKYRDGSTIPNVTDNTAWMNLTTGAQCTYNNTSSTDTISRFGRLYNFYAVADARNLAPAGWHVATDTEWTILINYVSAHAGASLSVAKALAATTDWKFSTEYATPGCNATINNSTGFGALPCGGRTTGYTGYGNFGDAGDYDSFWWAAHISGSNSAIGRGIETNGSNVYRDDLGSWQYGKSDGYSVRCVKD